MEKMICPNCQEELEFVGKKYCCPCCDREWNEIILRSKEYFNSNCIKGLNTVLAQEYKIIEELLNNKQIYGIIFQIKDLYELIIRIPVLITASIIIKQPQNLKAKELIYYLMSKPLSLGDWRFLLNLCKDVAEQCDFIPLKVIELIQFVRKLVNSNRNGDIVNWRNSTIAHGAAKQMNDSDLYDDVAAKLSELTCFFSQNELLFESLKFIDSAGSKFEGISTNNIEWNGRLYLLIDNNRYLLYPFFDIRNDGIYLFDRYIKKLQKTEIIDYVQSFKKSVNINELNNLFLENTISRSDFSTDLASYTVEERNLCEEFLSSGEYMVPDFLIEWLKDKLQAPKDVFLLKMEKGMGKSFFVRGLDPLSIDKIYIEDLAIKAFYINSTYNSRIDDFSIFVEDIMRKVTKETTLANNTFRLDINSNLPAKSFASFLNSYKRKYYATKKLLFVFDGIDELNQQPDRNITDFIPNIDDLDEGIYVLITCRECNVNTLSQCCIKFLSSFKGSISIFKQSDEKYQKFAKDFFDLFIIKKSRLFCKRNGMEFDVDFDSTDKKFNEILDKSLLNLALIKELITISLKNYLQNGKIKISINDLNFDEKLYEQYFESIKSYYGSKYYEKFINVLCCLSIADRPLTLNELAILSGNNNLSFAFLGFINSMRLFLDTSRGEHGTYFTLDHDDRKKTVRRIFKQELHNTISYIIEKICEVSTDNFDFSNDEDTAYYLCLDSILSIKSDDDTINALTNSFLKIPASLSWSQNYYENRSELELLKHLDKFSTYNLNLNRVQKLRVAFLYANAGLNELIFNNYAQSEFYFKKSVILYEQNMNINKMDELYNYIECLSRFATLLWNQQRNTEALGLYNKVIQYTETIHFKDKKLISKIALLSEYICYCNIANSCGQLEIQKEILTKVEKEILYCESSDYKRRTEPFLMLCWFYYYRDIYDKKNAVKSIKKAIDLYSKCAADDIGFYLPDLVKCYNYLLQYYYESKDFNDDFEDYIDRGNKDLLFIHTEKGYNEEETYLKYNLLCSLLYLKANKPREYTKYKNIAFTFFQSLSDDKRNNEKLIAIIKYYNYEEEKFYE